ncbi:NUDIX hydrolase [Legionella sp. km772]|uniref:NUDIX hydrolase n=1 Tax=Legionella sp. km772 TaxID=2498111 RepID=UPI000F8DDE68|nr:NUDIX hydrolase [Legionella sp. km772]RUR13499.1 NUDIX domain-containing protein [Legionella sp. km772]
MTNSINWLKWISEIQAIAQSGLTYSNNEFDKERYFRLKEIIAELAAHCSENQLSDIVNIFSLEKGYATPKIDVRSFILKENKLLLVKERSDNLWTLPGGWADVNESPSEAVIRETREETGYNVSAIKLLALWDKLKHDHPPQWPHAYKCFFYCEIISGEPTENLEISELCFFDLNSLPPLSTHRVTTKQLARLYDLVINPQFTQFD